MDDKNQINKELLKLDVIQTKIIYLFSYLGFLIYFFSIFIVTFYLRKTVFIKSKSFTFILLSSITGLIEIYNNEKELFIKKHILMFCFYIFQFYLVITSINKLLKGKYIFKSEKIFSMKYLSLSLITFILLPIIIFPYWIIFKKYSILIKCFQYIIIIISILYLYECFKKRINDLLDYLNGNIKENILIPYMEQDELITIYTILDNLWFLFFLFSLIYYILKLMDLQSSIVHSAHLIINLILLIIKITMSLVYYFCLTYISYLLNKNYDKGKNIMSDEYEHKKLNNNGKKFENENNKIEFEDDNNKSIDNNNLKANKNEGKNNEEEKLDDEEESNILKVNDDNK